MSARGAGDSVCRVVGYRPLRGLRSFESPVPGVPLRFTPGFMLSAALRAAWSGLPARTRQEVMQTVQLIKRNLSYYWRTNLAVVFGVATAVAGLAGAVLVGDSVRASLRDLFLQRLGYTDSVEDRKSTRLNSSH